MKTILFLLCATLSFAEVHERRVTVHGREWLVQYDVGACEAPKFENCTVSVPATMPPGQPHYSAKITVIDTGMISSTCSGVVVTCAVYGEKIQVGQTFSGQWTPDGCFEDDPVALVEKVLGHDHNTISLKVPDISTTGTLKVITDGSGTLMFKGDCWGSSTGGGCTVAQCGDGQINLKPTLVDGDVVIQADACVKGIWKPAQVKLVPLEK